MSNRLMTFVALLALFAGVAVALAEEMPPGRKGGPITITADSLSADSKARRAVFEGNVTARSEDLTLYADRMTVQYAEGGGVERIEAQGAVKVVRGERVITSGRAEYERGADRIVFSDSPRVAEGKSVITGSRIVYHVSEDRTVVSDSKVMIEDR